MGESVREMGREVLGNEMQGDYWEATGETGSLVIYFTNGDRVVLLLCFHNTCQESSFPQISEFLERG